MSDPIQKGSMDEPSVLDYVKSRLFSRRYPLVGQIENKQPVSIETALTDESWSSKAVLAEVTPADSGDQANTWRRLVPMLGGLCLFWIAQRSFEPSAERGWMVGVVLYALGSLLIGWAAWRGDWRAAIPRPNAIHNDPLTVRAIPLVSGLFLALLAFLFAGENRFTPLNISLLVLATSCLVYAFWVREPGNPARQNDDSTTNMIQVEDRGQEQGERVITLTQSFKHRPVPWFFVLGGLGLLVLILYFRFANLAQVPAEMNSDHAEKIMDVIRVKLGQTSIFFPNNGGREALQIYLAAGLSRLTGEQVNFMTLKTISTLVGFLALPFLYLAGKEAANARVGILAVAFAGVAYWPNIVSRLGLRLPFYILFTALIFYFLIRGLRNGQRNDFILLGLCLGISLYGYSADRILPLIILVGVGIYLLHRQSAGYREQTLWFTLLALVLAGVIFLPMLRYILEQPEAFFYRTLTRISGAEQPLTAPAWLILLQNTGRALAMFSWSNGEVWTTSIPYRPALEVSSGALFWAGFLVTLVTYLRSRYWLHLFLLLSIPLLMLPSTLSLAFPAENPNLYRTGGALIPVFLILGLGLDGMMRGIEGRFQVSRSKLAWSLAGILFIFSAYQGYNLVFNQYATQYRLSAWNTSEMGELIRDFAGTFGGPDNVWIMGYPYWVDTRLAAIQAGYPLRDFALFTEQVAELPSSAGAKMFILNNADEMAKNALQARFPEGRLEIYHSETPGKDFLIYFVPPPGE